VTSNAVARVFFRYDRKLLGELASCGWRALRLYFLACLEDEDAVPGAVGFLQSSGELLNFHPHVHLLVTDGGFCPDGAFHPLPGFDSSLVERIFRGEVLRLLAGRELISREVVDNLLSWRHTGFSAHGEVRVETRSEAARLGRYCIRCLASGEYIIRIRPTAMSRFVCSPTVRASLKPWMAPWNSQPIPTPATMAVKIQTVR